MRRGSRLSILVACSVLAALGGSGGALADHEDEVVTVTAEGGPQTWEGDRATGANTGYDFDTGEPCRESPPADPEYCDVRLLHVDVPPGFWDRRAGGLQVVLDGFDPPTSDFDLQIFRSDVHGTKGELVASSGNPPASPEQATIPQPSGYYRMQVVYFAVTAGAYTGTAELFSRDGVPPDVDDPPGIQEVLASDPAAGWTSRSEPHIARSPVDPDVLVAGSKFYNRDADALAEYEFKVGTYASFDGGLSWTDLGQTATCPPQQAGPDTWPTNRCYPAEDPDREGTGEEDRASPDGPTGPDFGEEYITSDPWVQFDDEGNAYLMVLDAPPFESGVGWGMTLHRWRGVSPDDLEAGRTWSERIPINAYEEPLTRDQLGLLDDKNTFAVNNAGPDGDGTTGTMVACWGQTVSAAIKQQIVCERSTDAGETWPDEPAPISDVQQLVIGVHVAADTRDPDTFYATWLQYATTVAGLQATLEFAVTTDGARTWVRNPVPAATLDDLPRQFPGQSFRNLSIPIMAVGPDGELFIVYAEYVDASDPDTDADGREADIRLLRSVDGGMTWSAPTTVNATDEDPNPNADQFQPVVDVTASGQLNVAYFDRRHDTRREEGGVVVHPGNYFTDVYLARSDDGGGTFSEHRLTHDATDPQHNAPVSPSGLFFGDYQGLVADDCWAIPFFNDTHLANDELDPGPVRDPDLDADLPSSPYQQVVSWRVPNTGTFGGAHATLPATCGAAAAEPDRPEPPAGSGDAPPTPTTGGGAGLLGLALVAAGLAGMRRTRR